VELAVNAIPLLFQFTVTELFVPPPHKNVAAAFQNCDPTDPVNEAAIPDGAASLRLIVNVPVAAAPDAPVFN
jgi:hypothetical protein